MATMGVSGVAGTAGEPWEWEGGDAGTGRMLPAERCDNRNGGEVASASEAVGSGCRAGAVAFRSNGIVLGFRAIGPCSSIG